MLTCRTKHLVFLCLALISILAISCGQAKPTVSSNSVGQNGATEIPAADKITPRSPDSQPTSIPVDQPTEPIVEATTAQGPVFSGSTSEEITKGLTYLTGSDEQPSKYSSYHIEYLWSAPAWDGDSKSIVNKQETISADVEGKNIHLTQTVVTGEKKESTDGYSVDGKAYDVQDGKAVESIFGIDMIWILWPLDPTMVMSLASLDQVKAQNNNDLGLATRMYSLDTANVDPVTMKAFLEMSMGLVSETSAKGSVWIDASTGALVKAVFDFEQQVKDDEQKVQGSGPGHMEILVSKIGEVKVSLP